ncbi:MAG: hypothetical protein ACRDOA_03955 [Streptosporangiaceae bacterium]
MPPVVDDALDESDALAFALADDDGLFVGLDEDLVAVVDTWPRDGAELEQLGLAVGWALFLADLLGLGLGLALVLGLEDVVGVADTEPPGLALGVPLPLGLALADALELAPAVLSLLVLPLEDAAGAVVVAVVLLGELLLVGVTDGCVDGDAQALVEGCAAPAALLDGAPAAAEGVGEIVPSPSVVGGALLGELVMLKAEPMASPTFIIPWRVTGTTDRTTPTANTAAPKAKAGRSMASRQSLGRCGSRRRGSDCPPPRPARLPGRRMSLAATPEMPSQTPRIQLGWLACAGRDRILSRIRSRPSGPGST